MTCRASPCTGRRAAILPPWEMHDSGDDDDPPASRQQLGLRQAKPGDEHGDGRHQVEQRGRRGDGQVRGD